MKHTPKIFYVIVSLLAVLFALIVKDSRCMYMNDSHWTPEGHELAAQIISDEITSYLPE